MLAVLLDLQKSGLRSKMFSEQERASNGQILHDRSRGLKE